MTQSQNRQSAAGVISTAFGLRHRWLEVIIFSFGSVILGAVVPFYLAGLISILAQLGFASVKDFPLLLIIAAGGVFVLLEESSVWGSVVLIVCSLLTLGIIVYLNCYFPLSAQRLWERRLAAIVRACGGGALAFGGTLRLWGLWMLSTAPDGGEQPVYGLTAMTTACVVGLFGALLAAYWPAWRKAR